MFPERSKASLSRFFIEQGPRWCHSVRTVVTDGSHSYRAAIHRYLPRARHVLDRFHAARWFAQGLTLVRRELQRRQPPGVKPALRTGPVQSPVLSPEKKRPSHPPGPTTSPAAVRSSSPSQSGLGRPTRALRPVRGQRSSKAPSKPSNVSGTCTTAGRYPSTTTPWTPSSTGPKRSSTGTTIAVPTDLSKASITSYKPSAEPHTGSPTPTTTPPEAYY